MDKIKWELCTSNDVHVRHDKQLRTIFVMSCAVSKTESPKRDAHVDFTYLYVLTSWRSRVASDLHCQAAQRVHQARAVPSLSEVG